MTTSIIAPSMRRTDDPDYAPFLAAVNEAFVFTATAASRLFTVDTDGLYDVYLDAFPRALRQHYTCHACRRFIDQYGGIVVIGEDGSLGAACWHPLAVPDQFIDVATALAVEVERRAVAGTFSAPQTTLGTPLTGAWTHLFAHLPAKHLHANRLLTPAQISAAVRENVGTVARALAEYPEPVVREALRIFTADAVVRAEKFVAPVQWLLNLHTARAATKDNRRRDALLWRAVATAPEGFAHVKASVVGPVLDAIVAGDTFETINRKFSAMLHPLRYQRPTAAPSAGNIAEGERIIETLGLARSLERRFARLDECETLWTPKTSPAPSAGGVFGHLTPKGATATPSLTLPAQTMTWEKFARTVLPTAERITLDVPAVGNFMAIVTAAHEDAPPILKWGHPVSSYVYHCGSRPEQWRLRAGQMHEVTAVVPSPNLWGAAPMPQHGESVLLVLAGAVDTRENSGNALFPEILRGDLHAVRATIEAYSQRATFSGREQASACGIGYSKGSADRGLTLRVTSGGSAQTVRIDRWD